MNLHSTPNPVRPSVPIPKDIYVFRTNVRNREYEQKDTTKHSDACFIYHIAPCERISSIRAPSGGICLPLTPFGACWNILSWVAILWICRFIIFYCCYVLRLSWLPTGQICRYFEKFTAFLIFFGSWHIAGSLLYPSSCKAHRNFIKIFACISFFIAQVNFTTRCQSAQRGESLLFVY